jgi:hypothetical protein
MLRDQCIVGGRGFRRQGEHAAVRLDDAVDGRHVDAMAAVLAEAVDVRHVLHDLDDREPIAVLRGVEQRVERRAGM